MQGVWEMVGVSKKRGGCRTCRDRKVKCDGKIPCGPCMSKRRECKPYMREHVFVYHRRAALPGHGESERRSTVMSSRNEKVEDDDELVHLRAQNRILAASLAAATCNNVAYTDQLMNQFIDDYTAIAREHDDVGQLTSNTWIINLPRLKGERRSLDAAILALSCAGLGRQRGDLALLRNATIAYGRALSSLQQDLNHTVRAWSIETLSACNALTLYQILGEYPVKHDWMSHVRGVSELVRLSGPRSFSSGLPNVLFRSSRANMILAALCSTRPTFLKQPEWTTVPFHYLHKTCYDYLIDVMACLPSIVAECVDINQVSEPELRLQQRIAAIRRCWDVERAFKRWHEELPQHLKRYTTLAAILEIREDDGSLCAAFPRCYMFPRLGVAHLLTMYWKSLLAVYNVLRLTYQAIQGVETPYSRPYHPAALRCANCYAMFRAFPEVGPRSCVCGYMQQQARADISGLPELTSSHDPRVIASHICMAIPYCLQQDKKLLGAYYTLWPLKMAIAVFSAHLPSTSAQLRWCRKVVDLLEAKGLQFSTKMLGAYEGRDLGGFAW